MKRPLSLLLIAALLLALLPTTALAASKPTYYKVSANGAEKLDAASFKDALAQTTGYSLLVDGGSVSIQESISHKMGNILLNNASLTIKGGNVQLAELPMVFGSSSFTIKGGAEVSVRAFSPQVKFAGGGSRNVYMTLASDASYTMRPLGKDKTALNPASAKDLRKRLEGRAGEQTAELTLRGKVTFNMADARMTGHTVIISKGATLTVAKNATLDLMGVNLQNKGSIVANGQMVLCRDIGVQALDMLYIMEEAADVKDLDAGSGAATKLTNYGKLEAKDALVLFAGASLVNYGEANMADVLNAGSIQNAGELDALVSGNPIRPAKGSSRYTVTFYLGGKASMPMTYTISVKSGATLKQARAPRQTGIALQQLDWFTDEKLQQRWDLETGKVQASMDLYAGF